ncbi:hypothetical protein Thiosp_02101 [Thiorhodovibrio litoralis]|nr:hypothetical protein [Thiorhodovibrio winogradskyi]WPL11963.1 hypothetical protein Thiosp_01716 [Thiorhodovibrio litoralis]WPL12337.1 hypothetical protein Thiosp_02101 [Thiorhodovibrio litoralis]
MDAEMIEPPLTMNGPRQPNHGGDGVANRWFREGSLDTPVLLNPARSTDGVTGQAISTCALVFCRRVGG